MSRKNIPLLLMLFSGAITCIITYVMEYTLTAKLFSLFCVLLLFYFLGSVLMWTLDYFDKQNQEKKEKEEQESDDSGAEGESEQNEQEQTSEKVEITEEET